MTLIEGAAIGATQTLALVPGISRSGVTIAAGLLAGLSYEQATRFSFMLATPIIGLAADAESADPLQTRRPADAGHDRRSRPWSPASARISARSS